VDVFAHFGWIFLQLGFYVLKYCNCKEYSILLLMYYSLDQSPFVD
jgi:hypothetical protein